MPGPPIAFAKEQPTTPTPQTSSGGKRVTVIQVVATPADTATPMPTSTATPTATPKSTPKPTPKPIAARPRAELGGRAEEGPPPESPPEAAFEQVELAQSSEELAPEPAPTAMRRPAPHLAVGLRDAAGLSLHVKEYVPLILGAAEEVGVDPAVIAALMETEGSAEEAVSSAGAAGLMQLLPDKLLATDDPLDPATNILRSAQLIRRLVRSYDGDLGMVAGAYFGAVDHDGHVTDDSDGIMTGLEYVERFADAYERWAIAFNQPTRPIAIRPMIRQRQPTPAPAADMDALPSLEAGDGPARDQWYLYVEKPQPALVPVLF